MRDQTKAGHCRWKHCYFKTVSGMHGNPKTAFLWIQKTLSYSKQKKRRLEDIEIQTWRSSLFDDDSRPVGRNKLRTFRQFKTVYGLENYLSVIENFEHRRTCTELVGHKIARLNRNSFFYINHHPLEHFPLRPILLRLERSIPYYTPHIRPQPGPDQPYQAPTYHIRPHVY